MKVALKIIRRIKGVMFHGNGVIDKPALNIISALWVKWGYVKAAVISIINT
jgi:hypothetical protein